MTSLFLHKYFGLNSKIHKRHVYGIISAFAGILMFLAPTVVQAAPNYMSGTNFPKNCAMPADMQAWTSGIPPFQSQKNYQTQVDDTYSASTSPSAGLSLIVTCDKKSSGYTNISFHYGHCLTWYTDTSGIHHLKRRVGTDCAGNNIGITTSNWPFHDEAGTSQDTYLFMDFYMTDDPSDTQHYHNLQRFAGTAVTAQTDVDVFSPTFDPDLVPNDGVIDGIVYAVNVFYDKSYTGPKNFQLTQPNPGNIEVDQCNGLDPICRIRKVFEGVANTFVDVGQAIVNGISALFIPDQQDVSDLVGATNTFFTEKLGFLYWPFDFVVSLFDVFIHPPSTWCNTSTCVINAGNVFGGNLSINLLGFKAISPDMWNLLLLLLRIGLVGGLIGGIHKKFEEITHR